MLMSIITVLIGFYDLYKNVPLMKATLSKLFGPFFDWIENWEMISRLQYLGTMLFLHNFEQAVTWALQVTRSMRSFLTILTKPVVGPLMEVAEYVLPVYNILVNAVKYISSTIWLVLGTSWSVVTGILEVIIWPFEFVFDTVLNTGKLVSPCFSMFSFSVGCILCHNTFVSNSFRDSSLLNTFTNSSNLYPLVKIKKKLYKKTQHF